MTSSGTVRELAAVEGQGGFTGEGEECFRRLEDECRAFAAAFLNRNSCSEYGSNRGRAGV